MEPRDLAWRGFVTRDLKVIAWPTMLAQHTDFHGIFLTDDSQFVARWRQWGPGELPDIDSGASEDAVAAVTAFLAGVAA